MGDPQVERWASSGTMALTGTPDRPLGPPANLVDGVDRLATSLPLDVDPLALLGERAALMGLWRRGSTSCGGSCRLFRAGDEWAAVSLPRAEDRDLVPAWLDLEHDDIPTTEPATWSAVARGLHDRPLDGLLERAHLLGLPVARLGETEPADILHAKLADTPPPTTPDAVTVVDLSSLWAGPLCGDLLAAAGATVIKVESTTRPDGARRGPPEFFDLLNERKQSAALDFHDHEDRAVLHRLVMAADVVIEASRPRALEQLGIHAGTALRAPRGPRIWVSITGYGRTGDEAASRVAFGDDAAVAGNLVVWDGNQPYFCSDAVADPLTGMTAAHECLLALAAGGRWMLDLPMAAIAARLAGPTRPVPPGLDVAPPRARHATHTAPPMGADTARAVAQLARSDDLPSSA